MQGAIIRVGLHASLDTVEGKGGNSRQYAGGGSCYLGTVALYPSTLLFFVDTGMLLRLRHGANPSGSSGDILQTGLGGHGSAGVYCG